MPAALESCVASLQAKWTKDPKSRPAPRNKKQDAKSQAFAICTATLKKAGKMSDAEYVVALSENGDGDMAGRLALLEDLGFSKEEAAAIALEDRKARRPKSEGLGPALKGIALTIIPFIKRQKRAEVVERDGEQMLRIPVMRKGVWRHPLYGVLRFDDAFFGGMIENFKQGIIGQDVPVKDGHKPPEQHAVGWVKELALEKEGLVAYAPPTDEKGLDLVNKKKAPYASAEFVFNWRDHEMKPLAFEDLVEVGEDEDEGIYEFSDAELREIEKLAGTDDCQCQEETTMSDEKLQVDLTEWQALQDRLQALEDAGARVETLEAQLSERDNRITELELVNESAMVAHLVERAKIYRDGEKRAHSAIFLNAYEAALTMSDITNGDGKALVSLSEAFEMTDEAAALRDYYRGVLRYLAEHMPGTVPTEGGTDGNEDRDLAATETEDENLGADLWD